MDNAVGTKGTISKGGKEHEKLEANLKGGTTYQFIYSSEVDNALKELQDTEAGKEVEQAFKRVEAALHAEKEEQMKQVKVFGGVSRKRVKVTGPSDVEIALRELENIVNDKYSKVPAPSSVGGTLLVQPGRDKADKGDKNQPVAIPTLPVHINNLVTLYREMVEMALSLDKSDRDRTTSPDKEPEKEKANREKNKSAKPKREKTVVK